MDRRDFGKKLGAVIGAFASIISVGVGISSASKKIKPEPEKEKETLVWKCNGHPRHIEKYEGGVAFYSANTACFFSGGVIGKPMIPQVTSGDIDKWFQEKEIVGIYVPESELENKEIFVWKYNFHADKVEKYEGNGLALKYANSTELVLNGMVGKAIIPFGYTREYFEKEGIIGIYVPDRFKNSKFLYNEKMT